MRSGEQNYAKKFSKGASQRLGNEEDRLGDALNIVVDTLLVSTAAGLVALPFVLIDNVKLCPGYIDWPGMSSLFSATPEPSVD
jgi:hypothetical protein